VTKSTNNGSDGTEQISSELNPLQNPTLGRNLGRWAQVYFTNPPERREQAVVELLRELETGVAPAPHVSSIKLEVRGPFCPRCQRQSQPGQKFCVMCGSSLTGLSEPAEHDQSFAASSPIPSLTPISPEGDAQWLRDKAFASFDSYVHRRQAWKYLSAIAVVALAGLGYWYFGSSARSDRTSAKKPPIAVASQTTVVEKQSAQVAVPDSQPSLPPANKVEDHPNLDRTTEAATLAVQRQRLDPNSSEPASDTAAGNGVRELLLARHFLDSNGGVRDTPEAMKWLWKAVGKQNTSAVILLADLYLRGDGVPKNCDQARLLLVAAAKKGASDAAEKLRSLESNGCS